MKTLSLPRACSGFALLVLSAALGVLLLAPAVSSAAESCENEQARQESFENPATRAPYAAQLPDCRNYELVSPDNNGGPVDSAELSGVFGENAGGGVPWTGVLPFGNLYGRLGSALDLGEADRESPSASPGVFWESAATPPGTGAIQDGRGADAFRAVRTPTGWSTRDILPYAYPYAGGGIDVKRIVGVSPDGSTALVATNAVLVPSAVEDPERNFTTGQYFLYRVSSGSSAPEMVTRGAYTIPSYAPHDEVLRFFALSASPDLSTVAFASTVPLESGDVCNSALGAPYESVSPGLNSTVYLWHADEGPEAKAHTIVDLKHCQAPNISAVPTVLPDGRPVIYPNTLNPLGPQGYTYGPLVVNNREVEKVGTLTPLAGPAGAKFLTTSPDGSIAYVQSAEALDQANFPHATGENIYAVSTSPPAAGSEGTLHGVACISCVSDGESMTYDGSSEDGSHLFFSTNEGLWSWDGHTATLLSKDTELFQLHFSENGQFVVGITSQALVAGDSDGAPDVYELAAGREPVLITSVAFPGAYSLEHGGVSDDGSRVVYDDIPAGGAAEVIEESSGATIHQISPLGSENGYRLQGVAGSELQDVLFLANELLVPADGNTLDTTVYDARVDGSFPPCTPGDPRPPEGVTSCLPGATQDPVAPASAPYGAPLAPPRVEPAQLPSDTARPAATSRALTRAQKLAKALKACNKQPKKRRATCVKRAKKQYAPAKTKGKK